MRTSRISKETSKSFPTTESLQDAPPARRSTRSSTLARFAYNAKPSPPEDVLSDIEDVFRPETSLSPPTSSAKGSVTRVSTKRKRATTTTKLSSSPPATRIKAEGTKYESLSETETKTTLPTDTKPRRAPRKPARKQKDPTTGEITVSPPSDWEQVYNTVLTMRLPGGAASNAAVDTMGCERLAAPDASPKERRFHTLIALMLSSQTKDTVNAEAMRRLQTELPAASPGGKPGLTLENILAVEDSLLNELIWKVGFHNNKTRYIKQAAVILRDQHAGDIPDTIEGMMALPGVGPKMAHLCMSASNGWNRIEGIGVDVHVHRITNLWGWQDPPTKTPEETRKALESWLPRDKWKEINWLLVGLGQSLCLPVGRKCGDCELGLGGLCKAAERKKVAEGRRRREVEGLVKVGVEGDGEGGLVVKEEEEVVEREVERVVKKEEVVNEDVEEEEAKVVKEEVVDDVDLAGVKAARPRRAGRKAGRSG